MRPKFWKLSQGYNHFNFDECLQSIQDRLVYVHKDTAALANSNNRQGDDFINRARIGDYFYMTHGNQGGIYLLGQFTGPANLFTIHAEGWVDRPFRIIKFAKVQTIYTGPQKWWAPNHRSTFVEVPDDELDIFEAEILFPYFGIKLSDYGVQISERLDE